MSCATGNCILADIHLIVGIPGVVYGGIGKHMVDLSSKELEVLLKVCTNAVLHG